MNERNDRLTDRPSEDHMQFSIMAPKLKKLLNGVVKKLQIFYEIIATHFVDHKLYKTYVNKRVTAMLYCSSYAVSCQ